MSSTRATEEEVSSFCAFGLVARRHFESFAVRVKGRHAVGLGVPPGRTVTATWTRHSCRVGNKEITSILTRQECRVSFEAPHNRKQLAHHCPPPPLLSTSILSYVDEFSDRVGISFCPLPLWIENEIRYYGVSPMRFSCGNDEHGCEREMEAYNGVAEGEPWWREDEDEDRGEVETLPEPCE